MLAAALEAEVAAYIDRHADALDENGHRLVVRTGHRLEREVLTGAGAVPVVGPRVNDQRVDPVTGQRYPSPRRSCRCSRKSPKVADLLLSCTCTGCPAKDFVPAIEQFLGTGSGLSAVTITRLTTQWQGRGPLVRRPVAGRFDFAISVWTVFT